MKPRNTFIFWASCRTLSRGGPTTARARCRWDTSNKKARAKQIKETNLRQNEFCEYGGAQVVEADYSEVRVDHVHAVIVARNLAAVLEVERSQQHFQHLFVPHHAINNLEAANSVVVGSKVGWREGMTPAARTNRRRRCQYWRWQ
jgi:hypothetical protein